MVITISLLTLMLTAIWAVRLHASRKKCIETEPWEELMKKRLQEQSIWSHYDKPTFIRKK